MKISEKVKRRSMLVLAALLAVPFVRITGTHAAGGIETDRSCSLTVSVDILAGADDENRKYVDDFNQMEIPVSVYRVADVDVTGQSYQPVAPFENMDLDGLAPNHQKRTAAEWQALSGTAEEIRVNMSPEPAGTVTVRKESESLAAAQGKIEGLMPGLYLVVPESAYNPDCTVQYTFIPYLTALPGNEYAQAGSGSDEWIYDTAVGLKPDAVLQAGRLNITKNLQEYNETLGPATFVFQVIGVDGDGNVKYEEMAAMTFDAAGSETITLEGIPAGLTVTVTEIYSGASYTVEGSSSASVLIWSDQAVKEGLSGEAAVAFTNRYSGGNRSGYGVTNHFESDGEGGWLWENPTILPED